MLAMIIPIEGFGGGGRPEHPIYYPPGIWPTPPGGYPTPPIALPPEGGYPHPWPLPPFPHPWPPLPGPPAKPANPIVLPPDQIWPPLPPPQPGFPPIGQWVAISIPPYGTHWIYIEGPKA